MAKAKDLHGRVFGLLTVVERAANQGKDVCWECDCACGKTTYPRAKHLLSGLSTSCGCSRETHGATKGGAHLPEYHSWASMKKRCTLNSHIHYKNYGGRGIKVCERWINSFPNFLADMGPRPGGYTLDRIDVNGNYEPSNCRWATIETQNKNRRKITGWPCSSPQEDS